jgi:hypothetical protein
MAQRSYHPLAKLAFAAAALLTLLTLTIHGHRMAGSVTGPNGPASIHTHAETFQFSNSQR